MSFRRFAGWLAGLSDHRPRVRTRQQAPQWGERLEERTLLSAVFTFTIEGEQLTIDDTTGTTSQDGLTVVNDLSNPEGVTPARPNGLWEGYSGTGYLNLGANVGDAAFFSVDVPEAGEYELAVRYGNGGNSERPMNVLVNGVEQATLAFAPTTNWDNWTDTPSVTLNLAAGVNAVRFENTVANGPNIDSISVSCSGDTVASEPGPRDTIAINFQDRTTTVAAGYLVDNFDGFGNRGNGLSYGWVTETSATDADGTSATPINGAAYPSIAINERAGSPFDSYDPRLTGYAHFDLGSYPERAAWEIALAQGSYEVTVSIGDTGGPNDSDNQLLVEGNLVTGWQPTDTYKSQLLTTIATVEDGFLTLAAPDGTITEMQYLEIRELPDLTPADSNPASHDYARLANPVAIGAAGTTPQTVAIGAGLRPDGIDPTRSFAFDVSVVDGRGGVLETSLTAENIQLYETLTGAPATFSVNTTGGFDAVVINPTGDLHENTSYTIVVDGLLDRGSNTDPSALPREFEKYTTTFVTGEAPDVVDRDVAFVDEVLATEGGFSSVVMSPDGTKLYVSTLGGRIIRWDLDAATGGIIGSSRQELVDLELDGSVIIGIVFDPADENRLWVTSNDGGLDNATDFTGRIVTVDIDDSDTSFTATTDVYIVGLPRSTKDHLSNSLTFRANPDAGQAGEPNHLLYVIQGSNSAMGAPDSAWGYRPERALSAAVIEIDPSLDVSSGPLDVQTEAEWTSTAATARDPLNDPNNPNNYDADGSVNGFYNPFAADAPVRVFSGGQRNAYDLVWHSNGFLYVPTNGSAGGANAPDDPSTLQNEGLTGIPTRNDYLFAVEEGGYYGHPNPIRGDFILNGGNPTSGTDPAEVEEYPVGTQPDAEYQGFAFDFGRNVSPNGAAEFTSNVFGNNLQGALIVAQYSGPDNLIALTPGPDGNIVDSQILRRTDGSEISYNDPLDVIVNPATGQIYLVTFNRSNGASELVLLTPEPGDVVNPPATGLTFQAEDSQVATVFTGSQSTPTNFIQIKANQPGFNGTGYADYGDGIAGDETLQFNVPNLAGGEYDLIIRYALNGADRPLDLKVNGISQGPVTFSDTDGASNAGFQTWGTLTQRVTLITGDNVIALTSTTNAGPNIDEIDLVPASTVLTFQAEDNQVATIFTGSQSTDTNFIQIKANQSDFNGTGFVDYGDGIAGDETLQFDLPGLAGGEYDLIIRYALNGADRPLDLKVNGISQGPVTFSDTDGAGNAGFQTWGMVTQRVMLITGDNVIALTSTTNAGPNIDEITLVPNADITIQGLDDAAADDRFVFSRIDNPKNAEQQFRDVREFEVVNDGVAPLTISDISISGNNPEAFQIIAGPANGAVLAAGNVASVLIEFVGSDPVDDNAAVSFDAVLTITSDDFDEGLRTIVLNGLAQIQSESGEEPTVAQIVDTFGYGTDIAQGQLANGGLVETIGDEVLMPYMQRLNSSQPIEIIQIAAYLRQGDVARLGMHSIDGIPVTELFAQDDQEGQTLLPNQLVPGTGAGETARGAIGSDTPFGLYISVDNRPTFASWSDPEANERDPDIASLVDDGDGHLIRFFQAKYAAGNVIEGTFIGIQDYPGGGNFDYNDHVFVIKNVQPYVLTAAEDSDGNSIIDALESDTDGDNLVDFFDEMIADLSVTTHGNEAGPADIVYTVTLSKINNTGAPITFDLDDLFTGTATSGDDYTAVAANAQISVAAGASTGTLTVPVTDDAETEVTETLIAQISNPNNTTAAIGTASATADISDNDAAAGFVSTVRVRLTDEDYLHLAEVEVFDVESGSNLALTGTAAQSSTYNANTSAGKAIDGDTTSGYPTSITHSQLEFGAWWLVDLGGGFDVGTITVHNRPNAAGDRLEGAVVEAMDSGGNVLWSDTITDATNGSIHTFVVTAAADITPPTADLADPTSDGTINALDLNGRDYLTVTFADAGGSELDAATIDGNELTLSGSGAGTAALDGTATLLSGSTYRYGLNPTGEFAAGSVDVNFVAGAWADHAGNLNVNETETFTVLAETAGFVSTVRVRLTDEDYLHLAEVEVFDVESGSNLALTGTAAQSSTYNANTSAGKAIDGDTTSGYPTSITHSQLEFGAWWLVDLGGGFDVGTITVHNRPNAAGDRLEGAVVEAMDSGGNVLWSDTITDATNGSIHTFVVTAAADITPPTADLADPTSDGTINALDLNGRDYLTVTFADAGGSELDAATIDGNELTLSGSGAGTAALDGTATLLSGSTYRYGLNPTGEFAAGSVDVNFVAGAWADHAGNLNVNETETFTVLAETAGFVSTVRVRLTDEDYLHLAEVEVFDVESGSNLALTGTAAQSSTYNANTSAGKAIDGDTTSGYPTSITHSQLEFGAWWLVDLGGGFDVGTITVHNRPNAAGDRLEGAVVEAMDSGGNVLWSDTITDATNGSIHTFVVTAAADITPPTADLADPTSGGTVNAVVLNGRDYLTVTFADAGGSELDAATIDGNELTLSGSGAGTAALDGTATLLSGSTYRYGLNPTGEFAAGSVDVNFVAGAWADHAGNLNVNETETFTVLAETAGFVSTVRVRLTDEDYLHLAEVEVFDVESGSNLALTGTAAQSSTYNANTSAGKAIDGDTTSGYPTSITHSQLEFGAWWLVDLGGGFDVGTITVHNRPNAAGDRLEGAVVEAMDSGGNVLWSDTITGATNGSIHTFVVTAAADITPPTADLADPTSGGTVNAVVLNGRDYLDVTFAEPTTEATEVERVIKQHDEVQSRWIDLTEDVKVSDEDGREMRDRRIAIDWHNFDDEVKTKFKLGEKFDRLDD